jgi:GNAT superfamily N-acetyltransferase
MENAVKIRASTPEDCPGISRLARELIRWEHSVNREIGEPTPWAGSEAEIRKQMGQPGTRFIIAERTDVIIGYAKVVVHGGDGRRRLWRRIIDRVTRRPRANFTSSGGLISGIFVTATERGAGVGRALCRAAEEWLRSQGMSRVYIHVLQKNELALQFWNENGYSPVTIVLDKPLD